MQNYAQPDFRNPTIAGISVQVEKPVALNSGPVALPVYVENVQTKDDPSGNIKSGKSGKGGPG